jgi:hypothetical protein
MTEIFDPFALARADAELIEAEAEFQQLEAQVAALHAADAADAVVDPVFKQWMDTMDRIADTPAASIAGAALKLRTLLHPDVGIEVGDGPRDFASLRQILAVLEREAGAG